MGSWSGGGFGGVVALVTHSHPSGRLPLPGPEVPPGVGGSWGLAVLVLAVLVCLWPRAEAARLAGAVPRQRLCGASGEGFLGTAGLCLLCVGAGSWSQGGFMPLLGQGCSPYPSHRSGGSLHGLGPEWEILPLPVRHDWSFASDWEASGEYTGWVSATAPGTGTWGDGHILLPGTGPCSACRDVAS